MTQLNTVCQTESGQPEKVGDWREETQATGPWCKKEGLWR